MSLPYPAPVRIKTKRRCMFRLPHMRYNCRALGVYVLNGRGYCIRHYDTAWKVQNPVLGTAHQWGGTSCLRCGTIRLYDGLPVMPCPGRMPRIILCN
jgi:hypothetical protein